MNTGEHFNQVYSLEASLARAKNLPWPFLHANQWI